MGIDFSDSTGYSGLVEYCDFLVKTNSTTYPIAQKTRNANAGMERVVSLILGADTRWKWDDTNHTDLPVGMQSLVSGQQDYGINTAYLKILKVTSKDSSGNYQELTKVDLWNMGKDPSEFKKTAGTPLYYEPRANSIFLYPKPNYASTNGLKVFFQRTIDYFATTDTTQEPGFASPFHKLIALYMARDYALANDMPNKLTLLQKEIDRMEAQLVDYYSTRDEDERQKITLKVEDYGARFLSRGYQPTGGDEEHITW